ncbi:CPBP family intramembrane glutamic endopeptidase [Halorubrum sp. 2020YC2]|uniref:CPBP family intramembrane glutamic endopeptidase n=1 Tax=Halorubrum sp. 2020YC2 TaxID=2836432 RepID=UPI001BEA463E|nr:CPBP family intramembrane glutamic endopeptidase [Halorubrum sp. 2020YC2]QWC18451.1 CPBP family intramembrane metalloprotease [Halorubrum sp. 2020YC2]
MVELPSTLTTFQDRLDDETGIARTGVFLALIVSVTIVLNLAASLVVVTVIGSDAGGTATFIAGTVGTELSFLLVGLSYLRSRSAFRLGVQVPDRTTAPLVFLGLVASFVTAFISLAVTDVLIPAIELSPGYMEYTNLNTPTGIGLLLAVILSLTVIGPVEEFFFRGVVQGRLRSALRPRSAIGVAGLVFALFHVYPVLLLSPPAIGVAHMAAYYSLMGGIFGWVYHRTDTLLGPALVHGTFNAVIFTIPLWT